LLIELRLEPMGEATRFLQVFARADGPPLGRIMANRFFKSWHQAAQKDIENFGKHVDENHRGRISLQTESAHLRIDRRPPQRLR
jgi:hypothetical protein